MTSTEVSSCYSMLQVDLDHRVKNFFHLGTIVTKFAHKNKIFFTTKKNF